MWTGDKLNAFTLTGDARDQGSILTNMESIHDDYWPVGWLIRDVIANQDTYDEALHRLQTEKLMAPCYYILGGLRSPEGAVIIRIPDQLDQAVDAQRFVLGLVCRGDQLRLVDTCAHQG